MRERVYCGLDAGSSTCHVVGMNPEGTVVEDREFPTSEQHLIAVFESIRAEVHVHLESTELAGWIRRVLQPRVARVVVGHARSSAWIARDPLKRDRLDATKLADLLRMGRVHEVYYPDEEERALLKEVVRHYDGLTEQEVRLKLQIKSRLRQQGVIVRGESVYTPTGRGRALGQVVSPIVREAIAQLYELLDEMLEARQKALRLLARVRRPLVEIDRLDEVPGVGPIVAARFAAYIQTPHRFSSKRKLWRYCRLGVTDRSSDGKPLGRKRLDWNGQPQLKNVSRIAFEGAMRGRQENMFKRYYSKSLARTHDRDHARLSTQRKILAVLRAIWISGERYDDRRG